MVPRAYLKFHTPKEKRQTLMSHCYWVTMLTPEVLRY